MNDLLRTLAIMLLLFFFLGFILAVSLWQLEIIWWCKWWNWSYNFGGLGDFGWQLYTWRDFWYGVIFAVFVALAVNTCILIWRMSAKPRV